MCAEPRAHAASTQLCTKGVDPDELACRAADLVDSEHAASQGRAARRAGTASAQSLPPDRWADDGQARSTTQCGANYMVQNQGTDAMAGLNPHTQRSHLPGASAAGAACAKAADLFIGVSDLGVAIDVWMAGMYHRRPMLDPQLERIGVGYARLPDGMLMAALRFESAARKGSGWPVAHPADKQTDVPLDYGAE